MQKECVHTLPHRSKVRSLLPHPNLPLLITGTTDGDVYLWSSTNFRLKKIHNICGLSRVRGFACLNEPGRVVLAQRDALSVIEIHDEEEKSGTDSNNNENSISAAD
ncbi:hypothetical protein QYE76_036883 [Lolium multiflorum]|uniref:Uncharacterized protein n=1 Tax=Lolium multiflorum TaxID=4521 RepID=A0AAD8R3B6_LOLMU|nr:hypothetical protein QYE76_036883 [Lolium multiflorum]